MINKYKVALRHLTNWVDVHATDLDTPVIQELVDRATATKVVGEFENNDKTIWGYCPHCNEMVLRGYSKWNYVKPLVKGKYCYKCSQKTIVGRLRR